MKDNPPKTVDDLPPDAYVVWWVEEDERWFAITRPGDELFFGAAIGIWYVEKCDAWVVFDSDAVPGWGPFIYDVAMEWATQQGQGLMPDRWNLSGGVRRIWWVYANDRDDVEKVERNVDLVDRGDDAWGWDLSMEEPEGCPGYEIDEGSLNAIYRKEPTTITQLKREGAWREREDNPDTRKLKARLLR